MSRPAGNRASGANRAVRGEAILSLRTSCRMLPLVQRIVDDIMRDRRHLGSLAPELERLDRDRSHLAWPDRARRYALQDEMRRTERELQDASAELEVLGISLIDALRGQVGFPTQVNGRRAYFSWRSGEDTLKRWHFAGESKRRVIPSKWYEEPVGEEA